MNKDHTYSGTRKIIADKVVDFVDKEIERHTEALKGNQRRDGGTGVQALQLAESIIEDASKHAFKAVGECDNCYGKGYRSVLEPAHVAKADFIGDKDTVVKPQRLEYRFCSCERGQALKHLIISNAHWVVD